MKTALKSQSPAMPVRPVAPAPPADPAARQRPARRGAFWPGEAFGKTGPAPIQLALSLAQLAAFLPAFGPGRH